MPNSPSGAAAPFENGIDVGNVRPRFVIIIWNIIVITFIAATALAMATPNNTPPSDSSWPPPPPERPRHAEVLQPPVAATDIELAAFRKSLVKVFSNAEVARFKDFKVAHDAAGGGTLCGMVNTKDQSDDISEFQWVYGSVNVASNGQLVGIPVVVSAVKPRVCTSMGM